MIPPQFAPMVVSWRFMLFQKLNSQLYFPVLQVGLRGKYRETDRRREMKQHNM